MTGISVHKCARPI